MIGLAFAQGQTAQGGLCVHDSRLWTIHSQCKKELLNTMSLSLDDSCVHHAKEISVAHTFGNDLHGCSKTSCKKSFILSVTIFSLKIAYSVMASCLKNMA